ncbi:MAG: hypothetical protein R6U98_28170 [Pirellulaceae bacterium]
MKRRAFLRTAGGLTGGAAAAAWSPLPVTAIEPADETRRFARRVLYVGPHDELASRLEEALPPGVEFSQAALKSINPDSAPGAVAGTEAIVVASASASDSLPADIERATRPVYDLLRSAADEGVRRVVYLSTLAVMRFYFTQPGPRYVVDENWAPRPCGAASGLPAYLGEVVCREFARARKLEVAVLRLGQLKGHSPDPDGWTLPHAKAEDVARSIVAAFRATLPHWSLFHIHSADAPSLPSNPALAAVKHGQPADHAAHPRHA